MYVVNGQPFKNKAAITERVQTILHLYDEMEHISESDLAFMLDILRHRKQGEKLVGGVQSIYVATNAYGKHKGFYIVRPDGSVDDFSYVKAIRDIPQQMQCWRVLSSDQVLDYTSAMREAVKDQVQDFKRLSFAGKSPVCPITAIELTWQTAHVDHYPVHFAALLTEFNETHKVNPDDVPITSPDGEIKIIADDVLLAAWREFHKSRASLRVVFWQANLQRPKHKTATTPAPAPAAGSEQEPQR